VTLDDGRVVASFVQVRCVHCRRNAVRVLRTLHRKHGRGTICWVYVHRTYLVPCN
jgi:hypothetical protein